MVYWQINFNVVFKPFIYYSYLYIPWLRYFQILHDAEFCIRYLSLHPIMKQFIGFSDNEEKEKEEEKEEK